MDKPIGKKRLYNIFLIMCIVIVLFSSIYFMEGQALAFIESVTEYDRNGGVHQVTTPEAGDAVRIPEEVDQALGTYEGFDVRWSYTQKTIYDKWVEQGKKASDSHWAYLEIGGERRYLVALVPTYGRVGDYVDIYLTMDGESKVYPCIMADAKDIWVDEAYTYNGVAYGHSVGGRCNVIEVCSELPSSSEYYDNLTPLLNKLSGVTQIVNGGSMIENPDGPIGLEGPYNYDDGTSGGGSSSKTGKESETFMGVMSMTLRNLCDSFYVTFENHYKNNNDVTVLYDIKNLDEENSSKKTVNSTDGFIQYYQNDYADVLYGDSNISACGCGPTSFAMVATHISNTSITPADAVAWCGNDYYLDGVGTYWSYFEAAAKHFNLNCTVEMSDSIDEVANALSSGALVISSQGRGLFTNGGHYIVLSEIDSDGQITVKDPNKGNAVNKGYNDRKFSKKEINNSAKKYWIFKY